MLKIYGEYICQNSVDKTMIIGVACSVAWSNTVLLYLDENRRANHNHPYKITTEVKLMSEYTVYLHKKGSKQAPYRTEYELLDVSGVRGLKKVVAMNADEMSRNNFLVKDETLPVCMVFMHLSKVEALVLNGHMFNRDGEKKYRTVEPSNFGFFVEGAGNESAWQFAFRRGVERVRCASRPREVSHSLVEEDDIVLFLAKKINWKELLKHRKN